MTRLVVTATRDEARAGNDPDTRYRTIEELREELTHVLVDDRPIPSPRDIRRWLAKDLAEHLDETIYTKKALDHLEAGILALYGLDIDAKQLAKVVRALPARDLRPLADRFTRLDEALANAGFGGGAASGVRLAGAIEKATPLELRALLASSRVSAVGHVPLAPRDAAFFGALEAVLERHLEVKRLFPLLRRPLDAGRERDFLENLLVQEEVRFRSPPETYEIPGGLFAGEHDPRLRLFAAPSFEDEATGIAESIAEALEAGTPPERISVLALGSEPRALFALIHALEERQIPWSGVDPRLETFQRHFFDLHEELLEGISRPRLAHLLRLTRRDPGSANAARRLLAVPTADGSTPEDRVRRSLPKKESLPEAGESLLVLSQSLRSRRTRSQHLEGLRDLLGALHTETASHPGAGDRFFVVLCAALDSLSSDEDETVSPEVTRWEVARRLEELGREGLPRGVRVAREVARLRDGSSTLLFVSGIDEESVRRIRGRRAPLPPRVMRAFSTVMRVHLASSPRDDFEVDLALAAQNAERLVFTRSLVDARGAPLEASDLAQKAQLLGVAEETFGRRARRRRQAGASVQRRAALETERERRHAAPNLGESPRFDEKSVQAMRARTGTDSPIAVTRLEDFAKCRFRGFSAHVLRVREPLIAGEELSPRERGELVHQLLETILATLRPSFLEKPRPRTAIHERATRLVDEALLARLGALLVRRVERERVRVQIMNVLDEAIDDEAWVPELFEQSFGGGDEDWPAYSMADGEEQVLIRGAIDRIDRSAGGEEVRVVDYKSSRTTAEKLVSHGDSTSLQLPIYARVAALNLGRRPGVPAFVLGEPTRRVLPLAPPADLERLAIDPLRRARSGDVRPIPVHPEECERCAHRVPCRRPTFFVNEDDGIR